jgi:cold shock CspA family protein
VVPGGSVNWFNPTGGAGFIPPEFIRTLRFERADLDGLREAQEVQFAWSDCGEGKRAVGETWG